ncbi:M20/M25/M40 family metallo-hydrolase [Lysinibacillus agricola]|uniref:M20/M25/M40 family metallo-hydrolase n=1 Tax=Lysinibacillus agricola TaxID=2590012 RepID=A0ABX7ALP4_9BACI|nr:MULTISPECIES: M20/M25/M40 family metallo-hydrolase [Lysinibacillus]KOS59814.1 hypothetical protein AN161_26190 [Lysinibacillus sp. FJAT-14222]QQP10589.1 M20/M25/M40 family metallo-hydrolase [Lysinibacillus agricola]
MDKQMNEERFLNRLIEIIQIDSPSLEEKEMSDYLIAFFKERGEKVIADDTGKKFGSNGRNVLVHIPGSLDLEPICFNVHMDTVEPGRNIKPIKKNGRIISDGSTILGGDDKAGIAMLLEGYEYLRENNIPHREMYFLFTLSEEIMQGATHYDTSDIKVKYMFVLDGAGHPKYLCSASKGKTLLKYEFWGTTAHSGVDITAGRNAVCMAAHAITSMPTGLVDEDTTVNISSIHGGKEAPTVPDYAVVTAEIRSYYQDKIDDQAAVMHKAAKEAAELFEGRVSKEITILCPPYHAQTDEYLYKRTKEAIKDEGLDPVEIKTGGSSDANIFGERGFICSGLGIGIHNVHTTSEYVDIEETQMAYRIMLNIMTN